MLKFLQFSHEMLIKKESLMKKTSHSQIQSIIDESMLSIKERQKIVAEK